MTAPGGKEEFLGIVLQNPIVREVLRRAGELDLRDWYLAAGCLFQTVWNVLDGRDPTNGIVGVRRHVRLRDPPQPRHGTS